MMVRGMDTEALKQYMLAHVQAKRPEAGYCFFCYALTDYQRQADALPGHNTPQGRDRRCHHQCQRAQSRHGGGKLLV